MTSLLYAAGGLLLAGVTTAAQYEEYILAPSSRTILPFSVYKVNGTVANADNLLENVAGSATFTDPSSVTLDFGKEIAGFVTFEVSSTDSDQHIGLAYTESSLWISGKGSDATADAGLDQILWFSPTGPGNYTVAPEHDRGGFRYLSLIHNTTGSISVEQVSVHFSAMPDVDENSLKNYSGYFHCDDELLNRVWYAGAYTNQLCTIDSHRGDSLVHLGVINSDMPGDSTPPNTWYNNYTITNGSSAVVDGAKRDRLVWAGDMAISMPSMAVSYNELVPVKNALDSLYNIQNKTTGQLPYAGIPFPLIYSATYHMYGLIAVANYYLYANAQPYLEDKWPAWKHGLNFSLSFIDESGMMNVTSAADWLRFGMGAHNIEANSILYYTINQGIMLGNVLGEEQSLLENWQAKAEGIKASVNRLLWNDTAGLFHDNETTTLMPQDGNCWAVLSNITNTPEKKSRISEGLASRWGAYGAPAPEADNAVSPFISGFELQAHALAGNPQAALDLMRVQWGFMLNDPRMTNSSFIEGYSFDGSLHYAPYTNDPRVSHAHGWSTGPTATLTFYIGGIHLLSAGGQTWELSPQLGNLTYVDTGFQTSLGDFTSQVNASANGDIMGFRFSTPPGTSGSVSLLGVEGSLRSENGSSVALVDGVASGLQGGTWTLALSMNETGMGGNATGTGSGSPASYTGAGVVSKGVSVVAAVVGLLAFMG